MTTDDDQRDIGCDNGINTDASLGLPSVPDDQMDYGLLRWTPGNLTTASLRRITLDAITDLWGDTWRHGERGDKERVVRLARVLEALLFAATGSEWSVKRR